MLEEIIGIPLKIKNGIINAVKCYNKLCEEHDYGTAYQIEMEQNLYKFP